MCRTFLTRHRTIARDRRGVAALEFGIIASTMVLLLLAAYDLGNAVYQRTVLAQAVRSAGQYALSFPTPSSGITTALTNTLPAHWTDASTSVSCTCVDGSGDSSSETDCDGCPSGTT
ncbi:MAG: TadE/TadG family type IV pilus assembly protein, partial [Terriglobales bacterium]